MTPEQQEGFRRWMEERFDRIDERLERETHSLQQELVATRHGLKASAETITMQVVELVVKTNDNTNKIDAINRWREDEGPLDQRLKRHSQRIEDEKTWRDTMRGGLIAASLFVPIFTGIIVGVSVTIVLKASGIA